MSKILTKSCTCKKCEQINPQSVANFYTDKHSEDGFCFQCKLCQRATRLRSQQKKREYRLAIKSGKEEDLKTWKIKWEPEINWSTKRCSNSKCNLIKSADQFYKCNKNKNGLSSQCKDCMDAKGKAYVALPLDPVGDTKKCNGCKEYRDIRYFSKDKYKKDGYSSRCTNCCKNTQFKIKYGITLAIYNAMLCAQNEKCAICNKHQNENYVDTRTGTKYRLAVDHCHKTGTVRGLLCSDCNTALGLLKENSELFLKAMEYLSFHKNKKAPDF